ncbi:interferon-induced protein with tetratricopeptide repeats 5-like [Arapaima gigas]
MSVADKELEATLQKLECPFTWDISKNNIKDLANLPEKLLHQVKFGPRRYHAAYLNILAFMTDLQGNGKQALEFLLQAEKVLEEDKQADTMFLVNYANFAWVHYHLGNLTDVRVYLGKLEKICKGIEGSSQYSCSLPAVEGEKGLTFLRLGAQFYERSKLSFRKAIEGEPDNVLYNTGYAVVLYRLEGMRPETDVSPEKSEAVIQLRRALQLEPSDAELMVLLALKLQKSNKHESLMLINNALRLSPDVPQVTRYVAKYLRIQGSVDKSLEILRKAVEVSPKSSFLYHQIGLCHKLQLNQMFQAEKTGKFRVPVAQKRAKAAECIHSFKKAVEVKPSNEYAKINLAEALGENHQLAEAEEIFQEVLKNESLLDSDRQFCHLSYGMFLFYKMKDDEQAVAQFKSAYCVPGQSTRREQVGKQLRKIAQKWINTKWRVQEAYELLDFMSAEDKQDRLGEENMRTSDELNPEVNDISASFEKMRSK